MTLRALMLTVFLALPSAGAAENLAGNWICKLVDETDAELTLTKISDVIFHENGVFDAKTKLVFEDGGRTATAFVIYKSKWSYKDGLLYDKPIKARVTKLTADGRNMTRSRFARDIRRSFMKSEGKPVKVRFASENKISVDHGQVTEHCRRKK